VHLCCQNLATTTLLSLQLLTANAHHLPNFPTANICTLKTSFCVGLRLSKANFGRDDSFCLRCRAPQDFKDQNRVRPPPQTQPAALAVLRLRGNRVEAGWLSLCQCENLLAYMRLQVADWCHLGGTEVAFTPGKERITFAGEQFWGRAVRASRTRQESGALLNFRRLFSCLGLRNCTPHSAASNVFRPPALKISRRSKMSAIQRSLNRRSAIDRSRSCPLPPAATCGKQVPREYRQILRLLSLL
jgi:hypothetical protein